MIRNIFISYMLLWCCSAALFAQPGLTKDEVDGMCGNFDYSRPIQYDSSIFGGFMSNFEGRESSFTFDGRYFMFNFNYTNDIIKDGIIITDNTFHPIKYLPGVVGLFNREDYVLRTSQYMYDVEKDSTYPHPTIPLDTTCMYGGKSIRLNEYEHVIISTYFGEEEDSIPRGFSICNRLTSEREFYPVTNMDEIQFISSLNLSYETDRLIGDFSYAVTPTRSRWDSANVLGMLNIRTQEYRDILPSQRFGEFYLPNWTPWGTILISYACRDDSSRQIWEIDTNGVFLRRLSDISMIFPPTATETPTTPGFFTLSQSYPNPVHVSGTVTIPYELPLGGDAVLTVYDIHGRVVERREILGAAPGTQSATVTLAGHRAGVYMYTLSVGGAVQSRRMLVVP